MSFFSRRTTILNSKCSILNRTIKENEEISSYMLTMGMAATIGRPWCLLDSKSSTLLLLHGHDNLGASKGSTYTQMRSNTRWKWSKFLQNTEKNHTPAWIEN